MPEHDAQHHPVFAGDRGVEAYGEARVSVDCDRCPARTGAGNGPRGRGVCDDCVVAFLLDREADDAVVHDMCEERALRHLVRAGLLGEVVGRMGHSEAERRFAIG